MVPRLNIERYGVAHAGERQGAAQPHGGRRGSGAGRRVGDTHEQREPVADIIPHHTRTRWLPGDWLATQLIERQADPDLGADLDRLVGQTIDEL
jgi:antitoxin (DNA-binding transcriptional repressor) of toxin-antitoxin stability system